MAGDRAIHHQLNAGLLAIHYRAYCECSLIDGAGAMKLWCCVGRLAPVYGDHCQLVTDRPSAVYYSILAVVVIRLLILPQLRICQ